MILSCVGLMGCFQKTDTLKKDYPPIPVCSSYKPAEYKFELCGPKYCVDENSAKGIMLNVEELKSCIDEFILYSKTVEEINGI